MLILELSIPICFIFECFHITILCAIFINSQRWVFFSMVMQTAVRRSWLVSWEPGQSQKLGLLWHWNCAERLSTNIHSSLPIWLYDFWLACVCVSQNTGRINACLYAEQCLDVLYLVRSWIYLNFALQLKTCTFQRGHLSTEKCPQARLSPCVDDSLNARVTREKWGYGNLDAFILLVIETLEHF